MRNTKIFDNIGTAIAFAAGGHMAGGIFGSTGSIVGAVVGVIVGLFGDRLAEAEEKWRASRNTRKS
ncbi:hypothetical protein KK083_31090 [Fulvivirgaceae bacterium PWU4]|uniref:Uncharacterized protein n=1 Tax=Chryseosolibacter histidini TaxID=2782349 RepID=A0AAP2GSN2_9BACT|nr:hypothetical protein [Chryseosolibacter histidini]MBT1701380.1 hypothetical protein [Chryseosolibacter histidini]